MRFLMRFLLGLALQSSPAVSGGSQNHILLAELGITVSQQLSWRLQRACRLSSQLRVVLVSSRCWVAHRAGTLPGGRVEAVLVEEGPERVICKDVCEGSDALTSL